MREPTIVLFDEDSQSGCLLVTSLMLAGSRCVNLGQGPDSVDRFRKLVFRDGLPDILVVDLSLPDLNGLDFLAGLAEEGLLCTVVLMSSDLDEAEVNELVRTPRVGFVDKNAPSRDIVRAILSFCPPESRKSRSRRRKPGIQPLYGMAGYAGV